jgi:hypothetical protein
MALKVGPQEVVANTGYWVGNPYGLKGAPGAGGAKGAPGAGGGKGAPGAGGAKGAPGAGGGKGAPGADGGKGQKGEEPSAGDKGQPGEDSTVDGEKGQPGEDADKGQPGEDGVDSTVDGATGAKGGPGEAVDGDKGQPGEPGAATGFTTVYTTTSHDSTNLMPSYSSMSCPNGNVGIFTVFYSLLGGGGNSQSCYVTDDPALVVFGASNTSPACVAFADVGSSSLVTCKCGAMCIN